MSTRIREFTEQDYDAVVAVHNAVYPDYKTAPASWRRWDSIREEKIRWRRFVTEVDGVVAAWGSFANSSWTYHPRKFQLEVGVHPDHQGRGLGAALYAHLEDAVSVYEPIVLRSEVREDNAVGRAFSEQRGYSASLREQESLLDITVFDPARFAADIDRVLATGIRIESWTELQGLPEAERRFHAMEAAIAVDVPSNDPHTPLGFEVWRKRLLESPKLLPDLNMIAVDPDDGDRFIGISNLWQEETEGRVETGLTGVLREYRKRGIATAMKVKALAAAKAADFEATITWNEENNRGMLGINQRLGFKFRPAWLMIAKVLDAEALAVSMEEES